VDVKKAKLDIWEDLPGMEQDISEAQLALDNVALDQEENQDDSQVESSGKWAFNKLLLIGAPIALVIIIACGTLVFYLFKSGPQKPAPIHKTPQQTAGRILPEAARKQQIAGAQSLAVPEKMKIIYLKDFMIDLKDATGNNHVLICDVVFDLGIEQKSDQLEKITVMRNIIYKTAQSRGVVDLLSVEERKKLKKECAFEMEKILGEGSVRNVYLMNYFIM